MPRIEKAIEIDVPVSRAYLLLTQFEGLPQFIEGVERVQLLDARHILWRPSARNALEEAEVEITEQTPNRRLAWRTTDAGPSPQHALPPHTGLIRFEEAAPDRTMLYLLIDYEAPGPLGPVESLLRTLERRVERDLKRFKAYAELGVPQTRRRAHAR